MSIDASQLHEGMTVRNPKGHRIGRVIGVEPGYLRVKQGWLFPDEFRASIADVAGVQGEEIVLDMRGTIPGEKNEGRNDGSRGHDVAARMHDERLL